MSAPIKNPTSRQGYRIDWNPSQTIDLATGNALLLTMRFLSLRL
jgi:hypothetical protein